MLALQHFLGQPIGPRVGVVRELAELRVDAPACLAAEQVREVHGAPAGGGVALPEPLGPRARPPAGTAPPGGTRAWARSASWHGTPRAPSAGRPARRSAGASRAGRSRRTWARTPSPASGTDTTIRRTASHAPARAGARRASSPASPRRPPPAGACPPPRGR